ncbi:sensor histidine kinase [Lyngbya confervoides]|uniref:histidine kinase n=1 Tax=Lyngbya confervoides BDU141951 TaxID=1574623 RepID=A0ABD4T8H9_9CYAN|nr:sensor histidine kinase [Lyngbya confervoides]MCM1984839.1 sensor histidine kinase [Lyngbya confervoides BDU141951]
MYSDLVSILVASSYIPHGHCYLWDPALVWLHVLSDGLIGCSYFSIPMALVYFVRQRKDVPYPWIFFLFGAFITACGITHLFSIWTLWSPNYWLSGLVKSGTALISLATAFSLIPVIPGALSLPSQSELLQSKAELEQRVSERTQALETSLAEKNSMLKEVHHRVKNNLQIISSLLSLQSFANENTAVKSLMEDCQHRILSMALIHEKLYRSKDLASIDMAEYLRDFLEQIFAAYRVNLPQVRFCLNSEDIALDIDAAIPCGLIVNELFSNALKHAFVGRDQGRITVNFFRLPETTCVLQILDDGVGMRTDIDWQATRTLGLAMVKGLAQQISGTISAMEGEGTGFEIIFPAPKANKLSSLHTGAVVAG